MRRRHPRLTETTRAKLLSPDATDALWLQHGDEFMKQWPRDHPGTRPDNWWRFFAPPMLRSPMPPQSEQLRVLKHFCLLARGEEVRARRDRAAAPLIPTTKATGTKSNVIVFKTTKEHRNGKA